MYEVDANGVAVETLRDQSRGAREGGQVVMARVGDRYLFAGDYQFAGNYGRVRCWQPDLGEITELAHLGGRVVELGAFGDVQTMAAIPAELRAAAAEPGAFVWWALTELGSLTVHVNGRSARLDLDLPGEAATSASVAGTDMFIGTRQGGTLRYSLGSGGPPQRLKSSAGAVLAVAATGDMVLSAGEDRRVRAFDRLDPSKPFELSGSAHAVTALRWLPDQRRFLSLSDEGQLRLWDLDALGGGETLRGHLNDAGKVRFSGDGRLLVTGGRAGLLLVWDALRGEIIARLEGLGDMVVMVEFIGGTDHVLGVSKAGETVVWNYRTSEVVHRRQLKRGMVTDGVWDPVRGAVAIATPGGVVHLSGDLNWIGRTPEEALAEAEDGSPQTFAVGWDPCSKSLLSLKLDGSFSVTDSKGQTQTFQMDQSSAINKIGGLGTGLPGTPSEGLAFFAFNSGKLAIVRIATGEVECWLEDRAGEGDQGEFLMGATVTPDGERILATTKNGLVGIWTLEGEHLLDLRGHGDWGLQMATSPSIGVCVSVSSEGSVRLWNTRSSKAMAEIRAETEPLAPPERIEALQREAGAESVLDRIADCVLEDPGKLPGPERVQLYGILRWQPENRRALAILALYRSKSETNERWISKLEQGMRDLPATHRLQPFLAEALLDLRGRLLKRAVGLKAR